MIADAVGEESPATVADAAEEVAAANSRVPRARPGDETNDSGALAYAADEGPQDIVAAALAETGATDDGEDATEGDVSDSEAIETVDDPIALRIQTASSVAEFADITLQSDGSGLDPIARLTQLARLRAGVDDIVAGAAAPERTVAGEAVSGSGKPGWHVQIGAVPTVEGANALLDKAKATLGTKFASLRPVTQEVESRGTTLYRARFAGFSDKEEARATCQKLKQQILLLPGGSQLSTCRGLAMLSEDPVLGFVDLRGESGRSSPVGVDLLHQPAMGGADFRLAGARLKPQDLIRLLRVHSARSRRRAFPPGLVSLHVVAPSGMRAVEITFQEP